MRELISAFITQEFSIFEFPITYFVCSPNLHKLLFSNALGDTAYSQEHLKRMVYAKFGGQTKCIMGNSKIENYQLLMAFKSLVSKSKRIKIETLNT